MHQPPTERPPMTADDVNVFRHVLWQQHNLILLAGAAGLSLALFTPVPLLLAMAAEGIWLMVAPSIPAFRRWLTAQEAREAREAREAQEAGGAALAASAVEVRPVARPAAGVDPALSRRAEALEVVAGDILELAAEQGAGPDRLAHIRARLQGLLGAFMRMGALHQRLSRVLNDAEGPGLETKVARLGQALRAEKDVAVRLSLRQALSVGQRRLKQHEEIERTRRDLEVKLTTLELAFGYLRSALVSGGTPSELIGQLDELETGAGFVADLENEAGAAVVGAGGSGPTPTPAPAGGTPP